MAYGANLAPKHIERRRGSKAVLSILQQVSTLLLSISGPPNVFMVWRWRVRGKVSPTLLAPVLWSVYCKMALGAKKKRGRGS